MNIASSYIRKYLNFPIKIIQIKRHSSLEKSPHQNSAEDSHMITIKWCILCNAIKVYMLWVIYCFMHQYCVYCVLHTGLCDKTCVPHISLFSQNALLCTTRQIGTRSGLCGFCQCLVSVDLIIFNTITSPAPGQTTFAPVSVKYPDKLM